MRFQKAVAKADWPRALKAVDELIKEQPAASSLHYNRGLVLKHLERLPDALQAFDRSLRLDSDHTNACFERGLALFNLGRFDVAAEAFQDYLHRSPEDADAALNLGLALIQLGHFEKARSALRVAYELAASEETIIALATAERECGAIKAMEQLIGELPDDKPEIAAAVLKLRTQGTVGRLSLSVIKA